MRVNTTLRKLFGERVKELRQASGLSQEAFADRCGFARSYMSRIERGRGNPSLDAVEVLSTALGVEAGELFPNTGKLIAAKRKDKIKVPFAADGSCFHPGLARTRTNRYTVGMKGQEEQFATFEEALEYLKGMEVACWRRPNSSGAWGIVKAVRWGDLPTK